MINWFHTGGLWYACVISAGRQRKGTGWARWGGRVGEDWRPPTEWVGGLSLRLRSALFIPSCIQTTLSTLYPRRGKVCATQPMCDSTIYLISGSNLFLTATIRVCSNLLSACFATFWCCDISFVYQSPLWLNAQSFRFCPFSFSFAQCLLGRWGSVSAVLAVGVRAWRGGWEAFGSAWKSQICFLVACWALLLRDSRPWGHCVTCRRYCLSRWLEHVVKLLLSPFFLSPAPPFSPRLLNPAQPSPVFPYESCFSKGTT